MKKLFYLLVLLPFLTIGQEYYYAATTTVPTTPCDLIPSNPNPELATGNASSYCTAENNSIPAVGGGDNQSSPLGATLASVASSGHGYGDYALELTAEDGESDRNRHYFEPLVNGQVYEYRLSYRMTQGTQGRWRFTDGTGALNLVSTFFSNSTWVEETGEFTNDGNRLELTMYVANSGGSAGDKLEYKFSYKLKDD